MFPEHCLITLHDLPNGHGGSVKSAPRTHEPTLTCSPRLRYDWEQRQTWQPFKFDGVSCSSVNHTILGHTRTGCLCLIMSEIAMPPRQSSMSRLGLFLAPLAGVLYHPLGATPRDIYSEDTQVASRPDVSGWCRSRSVLVSTIATKLKSLLLVLRLRALRTSR